MWKHFTRSVMVLSTVLAISLLCGGLAQAEKGGKGKKPPPEPPPEPTLADPAIAFELTSSSGSGLAVMNADGSNVTTIVDSDIFQPNGLVQEISWSPDLYPDIEGYQGSLVFQRYSVQDGHKWDLWIVDVIVTEQDAFGVDLRNLLNLVGTDAHFSPAWSPRGDLIAFDGRVGSESGIFVISPEGGTPTLVVPDPADGHVGWATWNPDGTCLAYACTTAGFWSLRMKQVIDPDTCDIVDGPEATVISEQTGFTRIVGLDWNRGGDWIGFVGTGDTLNEALYVVPAVEFGQVFLDELQASSSGDSYGPTWSSDDQFLLYPQRPNGPPRTVLVKQELATAEETTVFGRKGEHARFPDWRRYPSVPVTSP